MTPSFACFQLLERREKKTSANDKYRTMKVYFARVTHTYTHFAPRNYASEIATDLTVLKQIVILFCCLPLVSFVKQMQFSARVCVCVCECCKLLVSFYRFRERERACHCWWNNLNTNGIFNGATPNISILSESITRITKYVYCQFVTHWTTSRLWLNYGIFYSIFVHLLFIERKYHQKYAFDSIFFNISVNFVFTFFSLSLSLSIKKQKHRPIWANEIKTPNKWMKKEKTNGARMEREKNKQTKGTRCGNIRNSYMDFEWHSIAIVQ